ncbi:MAG: hypothetical protein Q9209_003147 [Squamulea sp. 1 TL-2023]
MRVLYEAKLVFERRMTKAYESAKQAMARNEKLENNLMTSLVPASLANVDPKGGTPAVHQEGLPEENISVFNPAGHDTTAISLTIGICLLAARLDIPDWIAEEINAVLSGIDTKDHSYEARFPHLPRYLAFVTVRLEPPSQLPKPPAPVRSP